MADTPPDPPTTTNITSKTHQARRSRKSVKPNRNIDVSNEIDHDDDFSFVPTIKSLGAEIDINPPPDPYAPRKTYRCKQCRSYSNDRSVVLEHICARHLPKDAQEKEEHATKLIEELSPAQVEQLVREGWLSVRLLQTNGPSTSSTSPESSTSTILTEPYRCINIDCPVKGCPTYFTDQLVLEDHLTRIHAYFPLRCQFQPCGKSFSSKTELIAHLASHSGQLFRCALCPTAAPTHHEMFQHTIFYHYPALYQCNLCSLQTQTRYSASLHYRTVHQADQRTTPTATVTTAAAAQPTRSCPFKGCTQLFAIGDAAFHEHLQVHCTNNLKAYFCRYAACDYAAASKDIVLDHVRRIHFGMKGRRVSLEDEERFDEQHQTVLFVGVREDLFLEQMM